MNVHVGQVYEDEYFSNAGRRWLVRVMKLNAKSVRVEPCDDGGWFSPAGYEFQYRMENRYFENGRMKLVADLGHKP